MNHTNAALGAVIKHRRLEAGLSQERLGAEAGYGAGAGVSISRVESGDTRPREVRLRRIAQILGATSEQLTADAERHPLSQQEADKPSVDPRDELATLSQDLDARVRKVREAGEAFEAAHDAAATNFMQPLLRLGANLGATLTQDEHVMGGRNEQRSAMAVSEARRGIASALEVASSVESGEFDVTARQGATAMGGSPVGMGEATAGLIAVAARAGAFASLKGGPGVTAMRLGGNTAVLAALVAAPVALAGVVASARSPQRNAPRKREEAAAKLLALRDEFEAKTETVEVLCADLATAVRVLEYVAVHGTHALRRWSGSLGEVPVTWSGLSLTDQSMYEGFLTIAAFVSQIGAIPFQGYLTGSPSDAEECHSASQELLQLAWEDIQRIV